MESTIRELAHRAVFEMQLPTTERVVNFVQRNVQADRKTILSVMKTVLTPYKK